MEAWEVVRTGLVADGTVKDVRCMSSWTTMSLFLTDRLQILYGVPVALNKLADLATLCDTLAVHGAVFRLLVDSPTQIQALETYNLERDRRMPWSIFVKVECGGK